MTMVDFITDLFCRINDEMRAFPKHPQAQLWLSKGVTLGVLHALKGVGNRAFYRGLSRDYHPLFPQSPKRTRLLQLFVTHRWWTWRFLAQPTLLEVIDSDGIERIHPFGKGAVRARLAARASLTTAGSSAISCACGSITWEALSVGCVHRPLCTISLIAFSGF